MIIFYNKNTGEIVASFPEAYSLDDKITVSKGNESEENFEKLVISPEESKDFEDPKNPKNIHDYKVDLKTKKLFVI